jgi:hypothetical protein
MCVFVVGGVISPPHPNIVTLLWGGGEGPQNPQPLEAATVGGGLEER